MNYIGAAISDIGLVKKKNQDSACIRITSMKNDDEAFVCAVCDGVSGLMHGEIASAEAVKQLLLWFDKETDHIHRNGFKQKKLIDSLITQTAAINTMIYEQAIDRGMSTGTTMSGMVAVNGKYVISHIGDSRIYRVTKKGIQRLTIDQTLTRKRLDDGVITEERALIDDGKHVLMQCVGLTDKVSPEIVTGKVKKGDLYMACSDGIYNTLDDEEIRVFLSETQITESSLSMLCRRIIDECKRRGECDNMTIAVIAAL